MQLVNQIKRDEIGKTCSIHDGYKKCIQNFLWKTPAVRPSHRWEDSIKMSLNSLEINIEFYSWLAIMSIELHHHQKS